MQCILFSALAAWLLIALRAALPAADALKKENAKAAKEPADGIYLVHEKGDGPKVTRNDTGATMFLGERQTDFFRTATMHSVANDNSRFWLHLDGAGPFPVRDAFGPAAVVISGKCYMIWSHSDRGPDGSRSVSASIHGEDAARAVAKKLKIDPNVRKHPGHKFLVSFEPDKASYNVGDSITLTMKIKNVGEKTACFHDGGRQRGPRDNQFSFTAFRGGGSGKAVPDTGDPNNFGGKGSYQALKPGDTFSKTVRLDSWFNFTDADTYRITATYRLEFHDPATNMYRGIWDDFATAECSVRVEAAK